jgi:hypothetical protein
VVGVHIDTKAHTEHLGLTGGQAAQDLSGRLGEAFFGGDSTGMQW